MHWSARCDALLVGGAPRAADELATRRAAAGVTAGRSLQHDDDLRQARIDALARVRHGQAPGLTLARRPPRDRDPVDQQRGLLAAVRALHGWQRGHRVDLHCPLGVSRAPEVALAYLTWIEGLDLDAALDRLRRARPQAFPGGPDADPPPDSAAWRNAARAILREVLAAPEDPPPEGCNAPAGA